MAASMPLVRTRSGALPETVADGKIGFLVGKNDPEALAQRILKLLQDDNLKERMCRAARYRVPTSMDLTTKNTVVWLGDFESKKYAETIPTKTCAGYGTSFIYSWMVKVGIYHDDRIRFRPIFLLPRVSSSEDFHR